MKKNAIITGGSRGLGKYIATRLARTKNLSSLTLISKNRDNLSAIVSELKRIKKDLPVHGIYSDLSNERGIAFAIKQLRKLDLDFNILINNASASAIGRLDDLHHKSIVSVINLNLTAPLLLIKFFLPYARKNGWGRIINISSISVNHPSSSIIPYIVSKAGLNKLSECIHISDAAHGITCNTIMPGLMLTDMGKKAIRYNFPSYGGKNSAIIEEKILKQFPVNKFTELRDVYRAIDFLLSGSASSISGEYIRIASGLI